MKNKKRKHKTSAAEKKARLEKELRRWDRKIKPFTDAIRDSETLTAEDYAVTINCRGFAE